jgi:hypothetical protein
MERSNEKALAILGRQYDNFINQSESWDFFRGLAEYVKTIEILIPSRKIIEGLEKKAEVNKQELEMLNTQAFKELSETADKMSEIAKDISKQSEPLRLAVKNMQGYLNGTVSSSNPLYAMTSSIFDVARKLNESGFSEAIKKFENTKREIKNIYGNYTFSPSYEKIADVELKLKRTKEVEPWGAWEKLPFIKRMVYEPTVVIEELNKEASKDPSKKWTLINLYGVADEMEAIREGSKTEDDVVFFKIKDFRSDTQRLHNFLITELIKATGTDSNLDFDAKNSILHFAGRQIIISKRAQNDAHELLRTIFKDKTKQWNNDEILDDWDSIVDIKPPKNKIYQAGKAVNRIVAQETQIKDFLSVNTRKISINKRYLEN